MKYNEKDFMEIDDIFQCKDLLYECSGIIHDDKKVYGYRINSVDGSEHEINFIDVEYIYENVSLNGA